MSFIDCIQQNLKGVLKASDIKKLENRYENLVKKYTDSMGDSEAAAKAASDFVAEETARLNTKRQNEIKSALRINDAVTQLSELKSKNPDYSSDDYDQFVLKNWTQKTEYRQQAIMRGILSKLHPVINQYRDKFVGLMNEGQGMRNIVKELRGENSGDQTAKLFAPTFRSVLDETHQRAKNAGANIGTVENYIPQNIHNPDKIKQSSFEEWYPALRDAIDIEKSIDPNTGLRYSEEDMLEIGRYIYDEMMTDGRKSLQKRADEGKQTFGRSGGILSERVGHSRFFHFKDADSYLKYNDAFGWGDDGLFNMFMGHFNKQSRNIAMLEVFSPNPDALHRVIKLQMEALPRRKNKLTRRVINPSTQFTGDYQVLTGWTNQQSGDNIFISAFNATGDLLTAAYLGAAPWAGLTDSAHVLNTAIMNGLDAQRVMKTYWKGYNPLNKGDREFMKQHGFSSHMLSSHLSNQVRMFGEISGNNLPSWLATSLNTASGLSWQTEIGKFAVASDMGATLGDLAVKKTAWRDVDPAFKGLLESHGMNEKHWDAVLNSNQHMYDDSIRVDPHDIAATIREATPEELSIRSSELKQLNDEKIAAQTERLEQASLARELVGETDRLNKLSDAIENKIQRMEVKQGKQKGRLEVSMSGERDAYKPLFNRLFRDSEKKSRGDISAIGEKDRARAEKARDRIDEIVNKKKATIEDLKEIKSQLKEFTKILNSAKKKFNIKKTSNKGIQDDLQKVITQSQERLQSLRKTDIQGKAASELKAENMQNALNASNIIADAMSELASKGANEATVRVRAYATGAAYGIDARKGTVGRAVARTAFMFKSFPMTVMVNHVMPALKMAAPALRGDFSQARFSPLIRLLVLNTMLGGFFLQAKQLITGKDFYDMETWQFWSRALLFGGGMGIMGDFMFQSYKGTGSKLTETLAGPLIGFYSDAAKVFKGNLDGLLEDQSDNALEKFRRDLFRFVKKNTPFNNLWYTQMFTNRWLFDQMESFVDPNYEKRMDDLEDAYLRSTGQGYWWKPGESLPSRAPQLGKRRQ